MGADSQDLLSILRDIETQRLMDLVVGAVIAIGAFIVLYVSVALIVDARRYSYQRFGLRVVPVLRSRGLWSAVASVIVIQATIGWLAFTHHPVKERLIFVDLGGHLQKGAFATLAIFTSIGSRVTVNRAGLMRVYSRAYFSPNPSALRSLSVSVASRWIDVVPVSLQRFTTGPLGRTLGVDATFAYDATKVGEHALREHFVIAAYDGQSVRSYSTYNVEDLTVVDPFSIWALVTNTALWQSVGVLLPLVLAALGLSKESKKQSAQTE